MQAQPRTLAAAGPRLSTATRSQTGDPARAGALRLAATTAQRNGWSDILLVEDGTDHVAFASGTVPQELADSGLHRVVQHAESRNEAGGVTLVDAGPDPAFADQPMLYAASAVIDGGTR